MESIEDDVRAVDVDIAKLIAIDAIHCLVLDKNNHDRLHEELDQVKDASIIIEGG